MLSGTVQQVYYVVKESDKTDILCKLVDVVDDFYGLVFCQTKSLVVDLTELLKRKGYRVDCLHGDMDQNARERTMKGFRARDITLLICTDVASRGLDVKELTHVINYSIPRELDSYVHRIGRTGRSGKNGLALSLVTPSHLGLIPRIEKMTQSKMQKGTIPTRKEIGKIKLLKVLEKFQAAETHERAQDLLDDSWKTILEGMTKAEIAGRFLTMTFPDLFTAAPEPTLAPKAQFMVKADSRSRSFGGPSGGFSRDRAPERSGDAPRERRFSRDSRDSRDNFKPRSSSERSAEGSPGFGDRGLRRSTFGKPSAQPGRTFVKARGDNPRRDR
jgi:ATP-dependent RNA helicase DeaD